MARPVTDGVAGGKRPVPGPALAQGSLNESSGDDHPDPPSHASDRPASVREAMRRSRRYKSGPVRPGPSRRRKPAPQRGRPPAPARELTDGPVADIPSREIEVGNEAWRVLVRGSSTTGSGSAPGARLLSVGLESPGDRPNPEGTHYLVAERLDDVDEEVLEGLVAGAIRDSEAAPASSRPARNPRGRGRLRRGNR